MDFDDLPTNEVLPCIRCVRSALKEAPPNAVVPLTINCVFEKTSSFKCAQCIKRNDTGCLPVSFNG